ncbi:MAG: CpaF family protein [Lachnospiraceae bacterium]|nr:CpaF family protein [Lachnospiraceae bacterium]
MSRLDKLSISLREEITDKLEFCKELTDDELEEIIAGKISEYSKKEHLTLEERVGIGRKILNSMRRLDILQELIDDKDVTEIMVNGYDTIFVEKAGRLTRSSKRFESDTRFKDVIQQIVAACNRAVNDASPIVDARLMDGSRVNVVLNPVAINGPILTIRRFPQKPLSMDRLTEIGSLQKEQAEFLDKLVKAGYNILVSGGTGSGKTTFLNALSSYIPHDERIITIEDSAELQIQGISNLVRLETKNSNADGCSPITIRDLIKSSLRMRPDRIVVGEVRGAEAMDMICSAMNCGHDGSMSTVHANSASDTIARLETMILMAAELPVYAIRRQISGGVDIIIHLGRLRDKTRKVLEITEVDRFEDGEVILNPLYRFEEDEDSTADHVTGRLKKTGRLIHEEKLKAAGIAC